MDDVFLGEIRYVGFNYAPQGWAVCAGQVLPIQQNTALYSLLGNNYGGNGTTTFALPDLRSRISIGQGSGPGLSPRDLASTGGTETVTLTTAQVPPHTHGLAASDATATASTPATGTFARPNLPRGGNLYSATAGSTAAAGTIASAGGNDSHENRMPGLAMTAIIALQGIYPQRP